MLRKTVLTTFDDARAAERGRKRLIDEGFWEEDVSLLRTERDRAREFGPGGPSSTDAANAGGAWGSLIGALSFTLVAMSVASIPGIGVLAVAPLLAAAAGAGAGGAAGALIGALAGSGVSDHEAHAAQLAIASRKMVVAAHVERGLASRAAALLAGEGGVGVRAPAQGVMGVMAHAVHRG